MGGLQRPRADTDGRCPRGQRVRVGVPYGHWKTTTFIGALTLRGFVAPFVIDGAVDRLAFETCVEKVLVPELREGDVFIMDNLPSHKGPRVRQLIEAAGAHLVYLPPYSPDFNPSRTPSPSSRRTCERPPSEPSKASGAP